MLKIEYKKDFDIEEKDIQNIEKTIKNNIDLLKTEKEECALIVNKLLLTIRTKEDAIVVEEINFL